MTGPVVQSPADGAQWQILTPDNPDTHPDGYAVVTADWSEDADRAEHYVAEGMTREVAELLVAAAARPAAEPDEPTEIAVSAGRANETGSDVGTSAAGPAGADTARVAAQHAALRLAQLATGDTVTQDDRDAIIRVVGELDSLWAGDTAQDDARTYECPDGCEDCQVTVDRLRARVAELETEAAELLAENRHLAVRWQERNARVAELEQRRDWLQGQLDLIYDAEYRRSDTLAQRITALEGAGNEVVAAAAAQLDGAGFGPRLDRATAHWEQAVRGDAPTARGETA